MSVQQTARGFSLAECLISLAMLSTVVVSFSEAVSASLRSTYHQRALTGAIGVTDTVTEQILLINASDPDLAIGTHQRTFDRSGISLSSSADAYYTVSWTVAEYEAIPGIREVTFRTSWLEGSRSHAISWSTYRR